MLEVGDDKADFQTSGLALHAPLRDHSAKPEMLSALDLSGCHRGRVEEERDIRAKRAQRQGARDTHARDDAKYQRHSPLPGRHVASPARVGAAPASVPARMAKRRRASSRELASSRLAQTTFNTTTAKVRMYEGQRYPA